MKSASAWAAAWWRDAAETVTRVPPAKIEGLAGLSRNGLRYWRFSGCCFLVVTHQLLCPMHIAARPSPIGTDTALVLEYPASITLSRCCRSASHCSAATPVE